MGQAAINSLTAAASTMLRHETGVLSTTTAFGKAVLAAWLIARRGVNTLVLVHRQQLLEQWVKRLATFLTPGSSGRSAGLQPAVSPNCIRQGVPPLGGATDAETHRLKIRDTAECNSALQIGRLGGGRKKLTGALDVALVQSLVRKGEVNDCVAGYGRVVVDECHHLSAHSFELVARRAKAKFFTRLSATVARKDGHHPIIFIQCGLVRHRVDERQQAATRPFTHSVLVRPTGFRGATSISHFAKCEITQPRLEFQQLYDALWRDESRNRMICADVLLALREGRSPLVLTERTEHLDLLAERLAQEGANVITLRGGMGRKALRAALDRVASGPQPEVRSAGLRPAANSPRVTHGQTSQPPPVNSTCCGSQSRAPLDPSSRVMLATERFIGEGFDDPRLDTLFFAKPVSERGTLAETARQFRLNTELPIPFDNRGVMEVDFLCADARVVIELDGAQHVADAEAHRRDRRKDALLQQHGYFVLRFLAEDIGKQLDPVLDAVLAALVHRRNRRQ